MEDPLPGPYRFLILAALILASGLLRLAETAFSGSRKSRLRYLASQKTPGRRFFAKAPDEAKAASARPLTGDENALAGKRAALELWNMIVRLFAAWLGTVFFGPSRGPLVLLAAAFLAFSEIIPRIIAPLNPEGIALFAYPAVSFLCLPWKPLETLFSLVPHPANEEGEEEFRLALEEGEKSGAVESGERSMVEGLLYLGDKPVSAFMTHRSEVQYLDIGAEPEEARNKALQFRAQGFFPVVREMQDDIAGTVSTEDIFIALSRNVPSAPSGIRDFEWKGLAAIMKEPHFIPETMSALKAFEAFRREKEEFLCVMDEYGGFAGTLRIYDLMEEIVGELAAPAEVPLQRREDGSWLADGGLSIDDLAKELGFESPSDGGYHTLAGFVLKLAGEIPRRGDFFRWGGYQFKVLNLDGNRIGKVLIEPLGE